MKKAATSFNKDATSRLFSEVQGHTNIERVRQYLSEGADPNARNHYNNTPLMIAAMGGTDNEKAIEALLDAGADPTLQNNDGETALIQAALYVEHYGAIKGAQTLLRYRPETHINIADHQGRNASLVMRFNVSKDLIEELVHAGIDITHKRNDGCDIETVVIRDTKLQPKDKISLLRLLGSPHANDPGILMFGAIDGEDEAAVRIYLENGADVCACNDRGQTPLWAAMIRNDENIMKVLLNIILKSR